LKFFGLLIAATIIATVGYFGYQQFTKQQSATVHNECTNSKLPPAADGTVYELEVCVIGKQLEVTFPDVFVGQFFPEKFIHIHNCKQVSLAKAGDVVPKKLKIKLPTESELEKVVIGNQGKTCQ
jgi:hypothetical protein